MKTNNWEQLKSVFQAALELEANERAAFVVEACKGDTVLLDQVQKLLSSHDEAGPFLGAPALLDAGVITEIGNGDQLDRTGQRIGPYEIVREIGRGGMGTVFLAVRADDQYCKQVAIKIVNRGMDTDVILRRFMMERQILANLEHPNIAGLLDGGSTEDGLPYFVMEYVEGVRIDEYCNAHDFSIDQRLRLFREVCSALQYAHQNLVVHRDIKPGNILITPEGTPKLLDFGIAKLMTPDWASQTGEMTASMVGLMTPEYASPEQLRGLGITTASDVYSLGVVLYELLSGNRPYQLKSRMPDEVAEIVLRDEPEKPSTVVSRQLSESRNNSNPDLQQRTTEPGSATQKTNSPFALPNPKILRGDLDNIVLKALRKEPERRYSSVQEFAEDIRRHLEGLPVTATPDTFSYRAGKFVQRHKAGVLAAAIVLITLVTATVITAWQARVARQERAKAEQRFNDVRKLANSVVFEFHDSIQDLPGSTPSRELLVSRALEYLDNLAKEAAHERSLQLELAAAYDKIGDIQGGFGTSHLGQRQKARDSYRKALAIREALVADEPANIDFRRTLATSYTKLGNIFWTEVDMNNAVDLYGKALAINQSLARESPNDLQIRWDLALSYGKFGYLKGAMDQTAEALENTRKGVALMEEVAAANPNDARIQSDLALSYDRVGEILTALTDNHAEALVLMRKAQEIGDRLAAADPLNTKLRRGKGVGSLNVALVSAKLGDTKTALDSSRRALQDFTEILTADPENEEFRQAVAMAQTIVCEMMIKNGEAAEAIKLLTKSLGMLEKSFAASPTDEIAHFRIANTQAELGKGHLAIATDTRTPPQERLAHWREARSWFLKSQAIYKIFLNAGKLTGEDAARLDTVNEAIAKCNAAIGS
jgi:non-specific serine/threonine protein kinase/serine/threonine-protein kinase